MKRSLFALTAAALLALPAALSAQGFGIAARAGTLGVGAEAAVGVTDAFVIRGGIGLLPVELKNPSFWEPGEDVDATLKLPKTWYNIGADLYLGGGFRVGGGMLFKPDDPTLTGALTGNASIDIGGTTYTATDVAEVVGTLKSKSSAPYALIGFGKHTKTGIGLFLDLGVAMLGDPDVSLEATKGNPTIINSATFQARLRQEEQTIEDDFGSYLKLWPILNIGIKLGIG
ncbi:MAG: hypothetical protein ACYC6F_16350 [Longimicrobiales bacterium]